MNISVATLRAIEYRVSEIKSIQREEARAEHETQLEDGHKPTRRSFGRELGELQRDLEALRKPDACDPSDSKKEKHMNSENNHQAVGPRDALIGVLFQARLLNDKLAADLRGSNPIGTQVAKLNEAAERLADLAGRAEDYSQ